MGDALWIKSEQSRHGPIVRMWMEDDFGGPYLRRLSYDDHPGSW